MKKSTISFQTIKSFYLIAKNITCLFGQALLIHLQSKLRFTVLHLDESEKFKA